MTSVMLATLSALVWGVADYSGGRASSRVSALSVTVVSQLLGLPVLVACLILISGVATPADLAWGASAGLAGVLGLMTLYRSLSTGAMAVAAPITAVTAAVIPMAWGLAMGERPSVNALIGVVCAVLAIGLVSLSPGGTGRVNTEVVGLALLSGALFGVFFILLAKSSDESGMWPLAAARAASISLGLALVFSRGVSLRLPRPLLGWVAAAGIGDIAANALYLVAAREGLISVVAPISSLYPVSTVLCALLLDGERVRPVQLAGLGLAAAALVLTAV
jgi:drug/metabolite transporter (DMT)-like permease